MRVTSVMPSIQANSIKRYEKTTDSVNNSVPISMSVPPPRSIQLSFTGADKNIHQFVSYAPENKRYRIKPYDQGGLGVVSYEAPVSWRLHEQADVRDFSAYHSYDNADGGIKVVKFTKKQGMYLDSYPEKNFFHAKQNETLADIAKRLNLKEGEELAYVIQLAPDAKGNSKFIRLVDAGVQGAFTRPSETDISKPQKITYRLFRAADIEDSVDIAIRDFQKKAEAKQLSKEEIEQGIEAIKSKAAPEVKERNASYFIHTEGLARFENAYGAGEKVGCGAYGTYGTTVLTAHTEQQVLQQKTAE